MNLTLQIILDYYAIQLLIQVWNAKRKQLNIIILRETPSTSCKKNTQ